ncbi:SusC/RagA family TonB-linked outer membrane protein [Flavobacterium sp.]|uniref:SusC/RagA family TonB-linked outer membrane protein n=8 Tax=Flavobacterium sp. TaxID=239 RepID=UPI004048B0FB
MRSKFKWIFTLLVAFTMQFSFAQEKTVTGVVSDELGPIAGANVVVEGTTRGTTTDFDGNYTIKAKQGEALVITYTGKKPAKIVIAAANSYNVSLKDDVVQGVNVIVVGYGKTSKEAFTGTATQLVKENLEAKTVSNISQALRGEVAGVNVITDSGAPGSDATIRIRGFGSVNGNSAPLYVVDGAPYSSDISSINPADIENITVLKDAAATSIYGSRGANGVILITTKQGKVGTSVVSVDFKTSINSLMLPGYDIIDSPEEYIETAWSSLKTKGMVLGFLDPTAYANANLYGTSTEAINPIYNIWNVSGSQLIDPATGKIANGVSRRYNPTKWSDAAFGTGYRSEANVQFSGGNGSTRYASSFGYLDDQGYAINSNYKRYTARINLEHKPKDWLRVGGNMAYTGSRYTNSSDSEGSAGSSGNLFALTNTTPAIYDVYLRDASGNLVADPIFGGNQYDYGFSGRRAWNGTNGIADSNYDLSQTDGSTLLGNFNFGVDLTKSLSFETRYSGQYQQFDGSSRSNPYYGSFAGDYGALFKDVSSTVNQNFLQLLRYTKTFKDHNLEVFAAHESTSNTFKDFNAAATRAISPNTIDLSQYTTPYGRASSYSQRWTLDSYFGQLNYNYNQKYFLTASVRRDGSSRFINNKWGTFGSAGLGWIVSKENFMSKLSFVDFFKLKASYGIIGDQGTSLQYGWQLSAINQTPNGDYSFTESSTLANPDLTWETSKIAQVGFESSFFNNTLDVNLDYYVKNTDNLFFTQTLPPSAGYLTQQYNDGQLRNSGVEFDIMGHILKAKTSDDLKLSVGINGEFLRNEITEMPIDAATGLPKIQDGSLSKGRSLFDFFMREWAGVDPATGAGLWSLYYDDLNGNGIFDNADAPISNMTTYMAANPGAEVVKTTTDSYAQATQAYTGKSAIPKVRGSFRLNAAYKNFDLTAQFSYSIGGYVYDSGYAQLMNNRDLIGANNWSRDILNAWKQYGDVTDVPRLTSGLSSDVNYSATSTRFLTKADFLSLNNVRLGYNIPAAFLDKLHLSKFNLFVSGDNLLMFSKRDGLNPTTLISSSNSGIYMPMTTFSFGTKIEF